MTSIANTPWGVNGGGQTYIKEKTFTAFCLWHIETSQTSNPAKSKATINVHVCVYISGAFVHGLCWLSYISVWVLALLVSAGWAMRSFYMWDE